jgi:factor associated with neutral sphingomyelinase activation
MDLDSIHDLNQRHALEVQIMEFGQIPKQIFTLPHPQRRTDIPPLMPTGSFATLSEMGMC